MRFVAVGTVLGNATNTPTGFAFGHSSSQFTILFTLDAPGTFQLDVSGTPVVFPTPNNPSGVTGLSLSGATLSLGGTVLAGSSTGTNQQGLLSQSGTLAAGDYTLTGGMIGGGGMGSPFSWSGGYNVTLVVSSIPLPAAGWMGLTTIVGIFGVRMMLTRMQRPI